MSEGGAKDVVAEMFRRQQTGDERTLDDAQIRAVLLPGACSKRLAVVLEFVGEAAVAGHGQPSR